MHWNSPEDAMPWVGLYAGVASLLCTLAMAADVFEGFRVRKLWFPCRFFTINAASLTLIAIAMKLPVDLTTDMSSDVSICAKYGGIAFLFTMLTNFLPSLGLMDNKQLLTNIIALGILTITVIVNVCIQISTGVVYGVIQFYIFCLPLVWLCSVALTIPTSRRILELKYQEMHRLASDAQERKITFSSEELIKVVEKYWMMAETGNHQFAIACSPSCSASGLFCAYLTVGSFVELLYLSDNRKNFAKSDYRWSMYVILIIQSIGVVIGSIPTFFRCFTQFSFKFSRKRIIHHINVFRVEKYWTQSLQDWKHSRVDTYIPGHRCKKVVHDVKYLILNFCIGLQIIVVVITKIFGLIPNFFVIFLSCSFCCCKSLLKSFKNKPNVASQNARSELQAHASYIVQIEEEVKLSKRLLRNTLKSITQLIHQSEKQEPNKLMKLLQKSTGFKGVVEFDNDQVPPLHPEEILNSWSLAAVTLTAIAVALPNKTKNMNVKGLLASVSEGLLFVNHIEESLNAKAELVIIRKAARHVWTDVELYCKWLQLDLRKMAHHRKTSEEILQWLGDEAIKMVIQIKKRKNQIHENRLHKFIAANSMYRIKQTILLRCKEQENWPNDEELFELISTMIADILCACFTNLPHVITMKCYDNAITEREESVRTAAWLLGKTKKILNIVQERQLPSLDLDSMAYIDEWRGLLKSQNIFVSVSSPRSQPASSSSSELLVISIE